MIVLTFKRKVKRKKPKRIKKEVEVVLWSLLNYYC